MINKGLPVKRKKNKLKKISDCKEQMYIDSSRIKLLEMQKNDIQKKKNRKYYYGVEQIEINLKCVPYCIKQIKIKLKITDGCLELYTR